MEFPSILMVAAIGAAVAILLGTQALAPAAFAVTQNANHGPGVSVETVAVP
jgi:hypothetical protein